jgi:hypothetical protein
MPGVREVGSKRRDQKLLAKAQVGFALSADQQRPEARPPIVGRRRASLKATAALLDAEDAVQAAVRKDSQ